LIQNGDFEQGPGVGWGESSAQGFDLIVVTFGGNVIAPRGVWAAWLGGGNNEDSTLTQQVTVPAGATVLSYYYAVGSEEGGCNFDLASVRVNGTTVEQYGLCASSETGDWVNGTVDLSSYAGQSVALSFMVHTDGSLNSNFFLDDVTFDSVANNALSNR